MLVTKLVNGTERKIATELGELPSLSKDSVRVVHRTVKENVPGILENGLKSKSGIDHTSDAFLEEDFWEFMSKPDFRCGFFGDYKVIMDIPIKEYQKVSGSRPTCYNQKEIKKLSSSESNYGAKRLVCPSKYIVGIIDHSKDFCKKCVDYFKNLSSKNPPLEAEKTDLRIFNQGRPAQRKFWGGSSQKPKQNPIEQPQVANEKQNPLLSSVNEDDPFSF